MAYSTTLLVIGLFVLAMTSFATTKAVLKVKSDSNDIEAILKKKRSSSTDEDILSDSSSYEVEGCFKEFTSATTKNMGTDNSNVRCQYECKDKGYILAATKGTDCLCGNIYPKEQKVKNNKCTTRCRSWSGCHSVQSCCGGPSTFTVSVVGDIDVAKQVLRRLGHAWQTNTEYADYLKTKVRISSPSTYTADWWKSFDYKGWSYCGSGSRSGYYMTGLYRSSSNHLYNLEEAACSEAPSYLYPASGDMQCYNANWWGSFDNKGWSTCQDGYYMTGLYRTSGNKIHNLEVARCCRPKTQVEQWGSCYNENVWNSFNYKGWSSCSSGYFMAGLYRNSCDDLYCIEEFKCCQMGSYNGNAWIEHPTFSINVEDTSGKLKHCSMDATDTTPASTSYTCAQLSQQTHMLKLDAQSFKIEDKTPLNVAKPEPIKNFRPVTCAAQAESYTCTKSLSVSVSSSTSFTIGSGFSQSVTVGASVEIDAEFLGSGVKTAFNTEITGSTSFNVESSKSEQKTVTDTTDVSIVVPPDTEVTINMMRTVQDLEYKWKAVFLLLGEYNTKWKNEQNTWQDVTTVLSGVNRELYAFGTWRYPDTDVIKVVVTDKFGKVEGCAHDRGDETTTCGVLRRN